MPARSSQLVQACDEFLDVRDWSDEKVVAAAREMPIDIAVDLKGYTWESRPGLFARRVAPLQVNFLGYPGTMGAPYFDYLIADSVVIPKPQSAHYSEKICRLEGCYQPNDRRRYISTRPFTRPALHLPERAVVFCCFNASWKIMPETFACWMSILKGVPDSVLWLLEAAGTAKDNLRAQARRHGVEPDRIVFAPSEALPDHLARHRCADLFVDTWPYNAHTTGSDALWAGLPLLACPGRSFAARVSASLLTAAGLPQLIAESPGDYVERAIALGRDRPRLAAFRHHLEGRRLELELFDTPLYTLRLEAGYSAMLERAARGLPAEDLSF